MLFNENHRKSEVFLRVRTSIQGGTDSKANFFQITKLGGGDDARLVDWMTKKKIIMSHEIQNEII
mgnify:CR=1 FL=1